MMLYANIALLLLVQGGYILAASRRKFDITYTNKAENKPCSRNGINGICVPEATCNEAHVILFGGDIDDTIARSSSCGPHLWCCSFENASTTVPPMITNEPKGPGCLALQVDRCPWCVKLYRSLKKGRSLFCGGILIGSKVILTTGTCYKAATKPNLIVEAKVPGAMYPDRYYLVGSQILHSQFNSGTREYDLAVFLLEKEVLWPGHEIDQGACLDLNTPLDGQCYAFGFDGNDQIISTILLTRNESCTSRGQGADAACGTPLEGETCFLASGLPVICKNDFNDLLVTGLVRGPCMNSSAPLSSLQPAASWISKTLSDLRVDKRQYTFPV